MLVQCPNCKTTYKVADEVLKGATPAFRCSRCRHTFELENVPRDSVIAGSDDPDKRSGPPAEEQELSFSFPAKDEASAPADAPTEPAVSKSPTADRVGELLVHDPWAISSSEAKDQASLIIPQTTSPEATQTTRNEGKEFADENSMNASAHSGDAIDSSYKILPMASYVDQQASIMPYLTLFGLLMIAFSLLTLIAHAHPKVAESLVKNIPLVGPSVLKNSHLRDAILLQSLRGGYQSIQGNREVFVITGVALNQNPVVIREIQLRGRVYNESGKELERQTIWAGNTLSMKIIRGMTAEDIPHLQSLRPLKSFELPPGDSVPFAIVFLRATKNAKEFSCEVALAEEEI